MEVNRNLLSEEYEFFNFDNYSFKFTVIRDIKCII